MASSDRFQRKLAAFLHDPIDKPLILRKLGERHEERARRLKEQLEEQIATTLPPFDEAADHVASAMERAFAPEGTRASTQFLDDPEVRHPFSGRALKGIGALSELDVDTITAVADQVFEEIALSEEAGEMPGRRAFLALWRNLLPDLRAASPEALAPQWSVLPADTRMPDHGLFQHLSVTSAFSGLARSDEDLYTDATFILVTIGPAQAFIKDARKTKDLYSGSYLLSHLTWTAMRPVVERHGPDSVLFPDLHGQPLVDHWLESEKDLTLTESRAALRYLPTLPNRFFAVVEEGSPDDREDLLSEAKAAVYDEMDRVSGSILEEVLPPGTDPGAVKPALPNHLRDALSVYGVALPFQPPEGPLTTERVLDSVAPYIGEEQMAEARELVEVAGGDHTRYGASPGHTYSLLYTLTEKMLAAQKNTRTFEPLRTGSSADPSGGEQSIGEQGRKCSLCGERNAIFYRGSPAQIHHNEPSVDLGRSGSVDAVQVRDGEGLCGMCFVKRFADRAEGLPRRQGGFPSTAKVAMAEVRDRYPSRFRQVDAALREAVGDGAFDHQLYFEENLRPGYLAKYVYPDKDENSDEAELEAAAERLQGAHAEHLSESGLSSQMTRYYALLALDGDHMGRWLSGAEAPTFKDIYHSSVWPQLPDNLQSKLESLGQRPLTPALHAALSRALADYTLEAVRPIVEEEHNGTLVYAGGDDVLAFVPLAEALDVATALRAAFSGHRDATGTIDFEAEVSGFVDGEDRVVTTLGPDASASVGLTVAHYKTPLGTVLETAYQMEDQAKEAGRNRLGIAILKRSGEERKATIPFTSDQIDEPGGTLSHFRTLLADLRQRDLSPTFIRTLQQELRPLLRDGSLTGFGDDADLLVRSEIARLLRRSLESDDPDWVQSTADRLASVYHAIGDLGPFLDALDAFLFLHRKTKDAHVRAPASA